MSFTPSAGEELQSEYFVALSDAPGALRAINELHEQISPLVLVTEVRSVAADDFVMSPCRGRESAAIHFTWRQHLEPGEAMLPSGLTPEVKAVLRRIEEVLEPFDPRPHPGKLFTMERARLEQAYPGHSQFREAVGRYDPQGKFSNGFLEEYFLGADR
ncbi:MAG: hypothetical protein GWO24_05015 [Akkermansiaceae bacterium]|nr:hypothetical protein [Akkermansiaceae bacterium]